jgi:S-adenosylmethionine decarboxylase
MPAAGKHFILEMYDCPTGPLNDPAFVRRALREAVKESGCTLVDDVVHQFEPQGVTGLAILAESHISIHTWPEAEYAAADVFTCGQKADPAKACAYLVRAFRAGQHTQTELARGELIATLRPELFEAYPTPRPERLAQTATAT